MGGGLKARLLGAALAVLLAGSGVPARAVAPEAPLFRLRSAFWPNLHHFLFQQAEAGSASGSRSALAARAARERVACELQPASAGAWERAVSFYRDRFLGRDLLFDGDLRLASQALLDAGDGPLTARTALAPVHFYQLAAAGAAYRPACWPGHDARNRAFISALEPLVARHGNALARRLAAAYGRPWEFAPLDVDVVVFGGWSGAYTTVAPNHVTLSSTVDAHAGTGGLEVLFHEASHVPGMLVARELGDACRAAGRALPRDLWHALIFFTVGESVRAELGAGYRPYAERLGLYERGEWAAHRHLLERGWRPVLQGRAAPAQGYRALCAALPPA
ncbi:MAG: hypothetical protein AB7O37_07635 [Vicinamibacteria bacterium]